MSDINLVLKQMGTVLSDGIYKYFLPFFVCFYDLRSGT
jgi:hypothetical protein